MGPSAGRGGRAGGEGDGGAPLEPSAALLERCRRQGIRPSTIGRRVLAVLDQAPCPLDIHELIGRLDEAAARSARTSIYRWLRKYEAAGLVAELNEHGRGRYAVVRPGATPFWIVGADEVRDVDPDLAMRILMEARRLGLPLSAAPVVIGFRSPPKRNAPRPATGHDE